MILIRIAPTTKVEEGKRIYGCVYADPRFKDGTLVSTSNVVSVNEAEQTFETHSGTHYRWEVSEGE